MHAQAGDRLHVFGRQVGNPEKVGQIVEGRGGEDGSQPYVVRSGGGHGSSVLPGPDAVVALRAFVGPGRVAAAARAVMERQGNGARSEVTTER